MPHQEFPVDMRRAVPVYYTPMSWNCPGEDSWR